MNEGQTTQGQRSRLRFCLTLGSQRCLFLLTLSGMIASAGCAMLQFDPSPPGTIGMQRERAVIHDPYASPDLGPPIVGGRPPGYDLPLAPTKALQVNPHAGNRSRRNQGAFVSPYTGF